MDTISQVVINQLCTGCGTCAGTCPNEAIKMRKFGSCGLYLPEIEEAKCSRCGICVDCCPGHSVDFEELNSCIFGRRPSEKDLGNYRECFIGHSNEPSVRYNSASGGVVSQLLIYALENDIVDGALVARMRKNQPLETEAFIARTRKEVLEAAKSKYCPVSTNEALANILKENGRFAVVGLPCHIHGIKKAQRVLKVLEERIVLHIGLMCSHTVNFKGTEFLLEKKGIQKEQVLEISYRGKGWPGEMTIGLKEGLNLSVPYMGHWDAYWSVFSSFLFTPLRCIACPDLTNELSDISLGDAWLPELKHDRMGKSVIMVRTSLGADLLESITSTEKISLRQVGAEKVRQSQLLSLKSKKDDFGARLLALKLFGKQVPRFKLEPESPFSPVSFVRSLFLHLSVWASSKRLARLFKYVPFPLFRLYAGIYNSLLLL